MFMIFPNTADCVHVCVCVCESHTDCLYMLEYRSKNNGESYCLVCAGFKYTRQTPKYKTINELAGD